MSVKTQLTALANVIRAKAGATGTMSISEMTNTLSACKTWGFEEVSGTITPTATSNTLTISNLPFSEIYMVYIQRNTYVQGDGILLCYFADIRNNVGVAHVGDGKTLGQFTVPLPTYSGGTLSVSNCRCNSSTFNTGLPTTYSGTDFPDAGITAVFSQNATYTYYIVGAKA